MMESLKRGAASTATIRIDLQDGIGGRETAPRQQQSYGTVSGWVVDQNGNAVVGTNVQIKSGLESAMQEVQSDEDGRFDFDRVPPGPFLLTTMGEGFVTQTLSHTLRPRQNCVVPPITISLATVVT